MWIFCGLGNPGREYENTRHNFGFLVITHFAKKHNLELKLDSSLECELAHYRDKALLIKPQTYMNFSGRAVKKVLQKYSLLPQELVVIYDDLDLPLGKLKLLPKGGAGGHKGVLSIIETLETKDFPRLKLGIGKTKKAFNKDYVLSTFSKEEWELAQRVIDRAVTTLEEILSLGLLKTMTKLNSTEVI